MQNKPIEVLDLLSGPARAMFPISERFKGRRINYHSVDRRAVYSDPFIRGYGVPKNVNYNFHNIELDFSDPEIFRQQLNELFKGRKFDEVHFHMPSDFKHGTNAQFLFEIAKFLRPGGYFYHSYQDFSPVIDSSQVSEGDPKIAVAYAKKKVLPMATNAGLKLVRFGWKRVDKESKFSTFSPLRGSKVRNLKTTYDLIKKYSKWAPFVTNFIIMQKPLRE
jgi:hypothetical protein